MLYLEATRHCETAMSVEFFTEFPAQTFVERLRQRQAQAAISTSAPEAPDWRQWLQYWDDEESFAGNLRNFEHWLQRAQLRV